MLNGQTAFVCREFLDHHSGITFALVDHITSPTAVVMPVKQIVEVCRERGVKVMVDAAHSPGQLPLDVRDLGAEFLTGKHVAILFNLSTGIYTQV